MTTTEPMLRLAADFPKASREAWLKLVDKALKGGDFEKRMVARTADGLRIEPLYTRDQTLPGADIAVPGAAPFTRGTHAVPQGLGWDIRQFHAEDDAAKANIAILEDLEGGANSIALQIADPAGFDLAKALDKVLLDMCPVVLVASEHFTDAATALNAVWQARGVPEAKRLGSYGADPLSVLAITGGLATSLEAVLAKAAALAKSAQAMPGVTAISADGVPYHVGGASEAQELAAMLAALVTYLRACETAGLKPAEALPKIAVNLAVDADQFLSIAKLRASRRLVWRVAEACGAGAAVPRVPFNAVTSYRMMAKRDPWTNMLRTTMAAAAAGLGGADAICVLPYTFALGKPDRFARRMARNSQIILQEESGLGRVVDPAGGSWYVETLTDDLARKAWSIFQEIEAQTAGTTRGLVAALSSGWLQERIAETAAARAKAIATGKQELTGVSAFPILGDDGVKVTPWPAPKPSTAAKAVSVKPLTPARLAEPFEALRDAADAAEAKSGKRPTVFLAGLGAIIDHNVRSTWVKNYLAAGGIAALTSDGYADGAAAASAFKASGAKAACICSSDAVYAAKAEATAKALKAAGAKLVLMAGRPGDKEAQLRAAGVDQFLAAGQNAVEVLKGLQGKLA